jgi:crotonobetainyl-CoA:carnitine CoA-transferase CaiB-like acyl-CoA transferase
MVEHPLFGAHPRLKSVIGFSRSRTQAGPAAMLGEHGLEILEQFGFGEDERAELLASGVVALD